MKKNSLAVAILAVAFLMPSVSLGAVGDTGYGFRTDGRLNQMVDLWESKEVGIKDKKTGNIQKVKVTKLACVLDYCFYRHEDKGAFNKSQNMIVFDVEDLLSNKNKGNQGISVSDSDLSKKSKEMGVEKERLKKALEDENEMARLLREIDVKRAEQKKKEEEQKKNQGKGNGGSGGGGGTSGGGSGSAGGGSLGGGSGSAGGGGGGGSGSAGGSLGGGSGSAGGGGGGGGSGNKKLENIYVNDTTGAISDTYEGACSGSIDNGSGTVISARIQKHDSGGNFCQLYYLNDGKPNPIGSSSINKYPVSSQEGDCGPGSNKTFGKKNNGTFSVVCTYKHKPKEENSTVGSTGSTSSANKQNGDSSSPNGSTAGGGGGGGRSLADHATTPDGGMQGGGKNGGSGQSGTTGTGTGTGTTGTGTGTGSDSSGDLGDMPSAPDGGGEPDWGGLKSDGGFGTFSPSSAFSTGGYCPQDIQLDFGQFGRHSLTLSFVCEASEKLRYVFITLAYFTAAMMIFKTVNSMKG